MRSKVIMAVVLLLALLNAGAGCAWFGGSSEPLVDVMKKVPLDCASFDYWAIEKLAADEDLQDIYLEFRDSPEAIQLQDIEIRRYSVKHAAKALGFDGTVAVFVGDFDVKIVAERLEDKGYQETTYQETEVWIPQDDQGHESVTLRSGTILIGDEEDLYACIDAMVGEEKHSLYDDPDIRLIAEKLPEGVIINIGKADWEENYADLITYGKCYSKKDEGSLKLTAIYMFQDTYAAGQARDEINSYLETHKFTDIEVERDEHFIRATALISIADFAQALSF